MEAPKTIEHQIGEVHDSLRFGLDTKRGDIIGSHPLESALLSVEKNQEEMKRITLANAYGAAFLVQMGIERQMLSRFRRPPGPIPSSMLGLEALTGSLEDFGFEDYLNDPRESETLRPVDMHSGMEVRLGISKGPACKSFM
ncbi:PREDICTED: cyclin-B1-2-like [Populus euphratica]|uniref:Cyclin-B1-2-like n=1 Tax=Populus euphratica TaxID=75702 RepID=A0AAJ6TZG4_POPEU|nr:PREDICTED: cyclin-B1-2-like [Populus euphratica]